MNTYLPIPGSFSFDEEPSTKGARSRSPTSSLRLEKPPREPLTEIKFETHGAVKIFKMATKELANLDVSWLNREFVTWHNSHSKQILEESKVVLTTKRDDILVQHLLLKPNKKLSFIPEKITLRNWESKCQNQSGSYGYEDLLLIGKGGFSEVFVARKQSNAQLVAIKKLEKSSLTEDDKKRQLILGERANLLNLRGPFLTNLISAFQTPKSFYFVMEYLPCGSLRKFIQRSRELTEEEIKHIICEIIAAMEFVHKAGYILRDLKSDNILLDENGHLYFCDLGLTTQGPKPGEQLQAWCGTIEYMAPEVMFHRGYTYSADYYSLGVIAYELADGRPPFYRRSNEDDISSKVKDEIPVIKSECSQAFKDFVGALLQKDPKDRLGSVSGISEIISHRWLKDVKFQTFRDRENCAPNSLGPLLKHNAKISRDMKPRCQRAGQFSGYLSGFSVDTVASDRVIEDPKEAVSGDVTRKFGKKAFDFTWSSIQAKFGEQKARSTKTSTDCSNEEGSLEEFEVGYSEEDFQAVANSCLRSVPKGNKQILQGETSSFKAK